MEMTQQETDAERAWHEFLNKRGVAGEDHERADGKSRFVSGFDSAKADYQPKWVRIGSKDDLPKERGRYLVSTAGTLTLVRNYFPNAPSKEWLEDFIAWQEFEPYQPEE